MCVSRWKHKWSFPNWSVALNTPMEKWVGDGGVWRQELDKNPPRKEAMIAALLSIVDSVK